jgi:ABC-type nitrate/sulfonate/bicarbonate transport system permease component
VASFGSGGSDMSGTPSPPVSRIGRTGRAWWLRGSDMLALPVMLVAAWWIATENARNFFFPPLSRIVAEFGPTWLGERLVDEVIPSLLRLLVGLALAIVAGMAVGLIVGTRPKVRAFLEPTLEFMRAVPPTILLPILMIFVGAGAELQIVTIAVGAVWPVLLNTAEGVRAVESGTLDLMAAYHFRPRARLSTTLRSASPQIIAGIRQALSVAIILMVVSEMFAATDGIGYTIVRFQQGFKLPQMWTGIILLGTIGVLFALAFRFIEVRVLRWYYNIRDLERQG